MFAFASAIIFLILQKQWKAAGTVFGTVVIPIVPNWISAQAHAFSAPAVMVYYTNYLQAAGSTAQHGGGIFQFVLRNVTNAFVEMLDLVVQILKSATPERLTPPWFLVYASGWLLLVTGVISELFKRKAGNIFAIWLTIHGFAHLLWPRGVGLRRMLVILPFVYYFMFRGALVFGSLFARLTKTRKHHATISGAIVFALGAVFLIGDLSEDLQWAGSYGFRIPPPSNAPANYSEAGEFAEAYDWIRKNTQATDVLVWNNDPAAYLWTGRKAILSCLGEAWGVIVHPEAYITSADLLESINYAHGDYLVIDPISVGGLKAFNQLGLAVENLMKSRPGILKPVFTTRFGLVTIFQIDHEVAYTRPQNLPGLR
jgi:hypothetical protein